MENIIHILNGDSASQPFEDSSLTGETLVWREVLSEGPINHEFGSEEFWKEREQYMNQAFQIPEGGYNDQVRKHFEQFVKAIDKYQQITLWFEYDLFCQINMIALIAYIGKIKKPETELSLICAGKIDDSSRLYGLGELNGNHFIKLYETRVKLGSREIDYAGEVFGVYCSPNHDDLFNYILMPFREYQHLSPALESHWKRFPSVQSGFTEIEQQMINFILKGVKSQNQLVGKMLEWQKFYGFGDLQYFNIIDRLKPLFSDFEKLKLKTNWQNIKIDRNYQLGGTWVKDWFFDEANQELVSK